MERLEKEPTMDDLRQEAVRVYGDTAVVDNAQSYVSVYETYLYSQMGVFILRCPTFKSAYAALLQLPNYGERLL